MSNRAGNEPSRSLKFQYLDEQVRALDISGELLAHPVHQPVQAVAAVAQVAAEAHAALHRSDSSPEHDPGRLLRHGALALVVAGIIAPSEAVQIDRSNVTLQPLVDV